MEHEPADYTFAPAPSRPTRKGFFLRLILVIIIIGSIIITATVAFLRDTHFQFTQVVVSGTQTFSPDVVTQFTYDYLARPKFASVRNSSTLLFSRKNFEMLLEKEFPIIDVAYVTINDPHTLGIHIKERTPAVVWCFTDNSCGFVDAQGILYGYAPQFSDGVYPVFTSESIPSSNHLIGTEIMHPADINRFAKLFKALQSDDITLSRVNFKSDGDITFSIEKLFGTYPPDNAVVMGTVGQDDAIFLRDSITGLAQDVFKKQYLAAPKTLEYIDLRFPGKVFYKFTTNSKPLTNQTQ